MPHTYAHYLPLRTLARVQCGRDTCVLRMHVTLCYMRVYLCAYRNPYAWLGKGNVRGYVPHVCMPNVHRYSRVRTYYPAGWVRVWVYAYLCACRT
jgi:hypothetical protein